MLRWPLFLPAAARAALARHEAVFTTFCDTGSIEAGTCWCKGGSAVAALGDGSWLWFELVGDPCAAQSGDRCDCTSCGGAAADCPHDGCWQCQGVGAPQCEPSELLKRWKDLSTAAAAAGLLFVPCFPPEHCWIYQKIIIFNRKSSPPQIPTWPETEKCGC